MTGHYDDGSVRDLTHESQYAVVPPGLADGIADRRRQARRPWAGPTRGRGRGADRPRPRSTSRGPTGSGRSAIGTTSSRCSRRPAATWGPATATSTARGGSGSASGATTRRFDLVSLTRDTLGRRVDRNVPRQSLVVLKPTGQLPHEGGLRFPAGIARGRHPARLDRRRGGGRCCRRLQAEAADRLSRRTDRRRAGADPATGGHGRVLRRHDARRHPAGVLRRQRPDHGATVTVDGRVEATAPVRDDRRRPLPGRPRDQPPRLPGRPARLRLERPRPSAT